MRKKYKFVLPKIKKYDKLIFAKHGEMSEWSNVHAWKACIPKGIGGSNPLLSAKARKTPKRVFFALYGEKGFELGASKL